jgi:putative transposase
LVLGSIIGVAIITAPASDEAATKLLYLILNRSEKEWKMPPREWSMAKAQFAVIFGERFIKAMAA